MEKPTNKRKREQDSSSGSSEEPPASRPQPSTSGSQVHPVQPERSSSPQPSISGHQVNAAPPERSSTPEPSSSGPQGGEQEAAPTGPRPFGPSPRDRAPQRRPERHQPPAGGRRRPRDCRFDVQGRSCLIWRVTSLKVYIWFANRHKEIKRRANIEATILESHGIDVQSQGGHSNSDDIDANDFSEQACDLPYFDKRPLSRPFGLYRLEPTSPTQDDSAAHSEHQDPISLAVEMAAVNHTILALSRTGGVPNDIKTESLEDE